MPDILDKDIRFAEQIRRLVEILIEHSVTFSHPLTQTLTRIVGMAWIK